MVSTATGDVFSLLLRREARVRSFPMPQTAFLLWCIHNGVDVMPCYIRTRRNLASDPITRSDMDGVRPGYAGLIWRGRIFLGGGGLCLDMVA